MINALDLDYKQLKRTRRVNGERVIEFTVFPTDENKQYFDLIVEEAIVTFKDDEYVIKKLEEKSIGKTYFKQVTAIHKFYVDLINKQQINTHDGSITFKNYMDMVFEGTGYDYEIHGDFLAREFQNLGNDNRLSLLLNGVNRWKAEFQLIDDKVHIHKEIGKKSDYQFRYGHNVKALNISTDTTDLKTKIYGRGAEGLEITYTSPNAAIFGIIEAPSVIDERYHNEDALLEEMKSRLQDTPILSITIDFVELRAAGYPYNEINEGDYVFVIYEPINNLLIETRVMEIVEIFDKNLKPIKTEVTLSNIKKTFSTSASEAIVEVRKKAIEYTDEELRKFRNRGEFDDILVKTEHSPANTHIGPHDITMRDNSLAEHTKSIYFTYGKARLASNGDRDALELDISEKYEWNIISSAYVETFDFPEIGNKKLQFNLGGNLSMAFGNLEVDGFTYHAKNKGSSRLSVQGHGESNPMMGVYMEINYDPSDISGRTSPKVKNQLNQGYLNVEIRGAPFLQEIEHLDYKTLKYIELVRVNLEGLEYTKDNYIKVDDKDIEETKTFESFVSVISLESDGKITKYKKDATIKLHPVFINNKQNINYWLLDFEADTFSPEELNEKEILSVNSAFVVYPYLNQEIEFGPNDEFWMNWWRGIGVGTRY